MALQILDGGHIAYAQGMQAQHFYLAWGDLESPAKATLANVAFAVSTNTCTKAGHTLLNGDRVYFTTIVGTTGIITNQFYYVITSVPVSGTFQLSSTFNGPVIDLTGSNGTGTLVYGTNYINDTWNNPLVPDSPVLSMTQLYNELGRQRVRGDVIGQGNKYCELVPTVAQTGVFNAATNAVTWGEGELLYPTGTPGSFNTTDTLPAELSIGNTYYMIYDPDNAVNYIASSVENAEANIAINITSVGLGTHTFTANTSNLIYSDNNYWIVTTYPTKNLYLQFSFDRLAAADKTIYQVGLFLNPILTGAAGLEYYPPANVSHPGTLMMVDNMIGIVRNDATFETFDVVITF